MYDHGDESFLGAFGRAEKEAFQEVQVSKIFTFKPKTNESSNYSLNETRNKKKKVKLSVKFKNG